MQLRFSGNGSVRAIGMVCIVMAPASAGAQGGSWTANAPMLTAREGAVAAGVGETVYVFGGLVGNTCQGISTVEAYDAASDQWSTRRCRRRGGAPAQPSSTGSST